jgi:hypothetical protein
VLLRYPCSLASQPTPRPPASAPLAPQEKNPRRATVQNALLKFVQSVTKHKWAHPFKRPVTEKEAPDYKDIVKQPMDFATLRKRVEAVRDGCKRVEKGRGAHKLGRRTRSSVRRRRRRRQTTRTL